MDDLLHVAELCGPDATDCQAAPELLMPATILGPNEARCKAPEVDIWPPWERRQLLELTINGDAAAKTANNHSFAIFGQPGFEVAISSVRPQGAPTAGGTLVEVRGTGLFELGDARVRFGEFASVQAVNCSADGQSMFVLSPPVAKPNLLSRAVWLAPAPNGGAFRVSMVRFTFFNVGGSAVSRVVPQGGPVTGGTRVTMHGAGFLSLPAATRSWGAAAESWGLGTSCLFGTVSVPATIRSTGSKDNVSDLALCDAPSGSAAAMVALELSLNGEADELRRTSDGVEYHFYDPAAVQVTGVFPLGGPSRGGTLVTLTGSGFYDRGGVFCRFGDLGHRAQSPDDPTIHLRWGRMDGVVPATLLSSTQLLCESPPGGLDTLGRAVDAGSAVDMALTLNADHGAYIETSAVFFYENATTRVDATLPVAGPSSGGSLLNVSGVGFADWGQLTCRFGSEELVTSATLVSSNLVQCRSPPYSAPALLGLPSALGRDVDQGSCSPYPHLKTQAACESYGVCSDPLKLTEGTCGTCRVVRALGIETSAGAVSSKTLCEGVEGTWTALQWTPHPGVWQEAPAPAALPSSPLDFASADAAAHAAATKSAAAVAAASAHAATLAAALKDDGGPSTPSLVAATADAAALAIAANSSAALAAVSAHAAALAPAALASSTLAAAIATAAAAAAALVNASSSAATVATAARDAAAFARDSNNFLDRRAAFAAAAGVPAAASSASALAVASATAATNASSAITTAALNAAAIPVNGQREWVRVSPNGQQYFFSDARFVYYSQERVRVSALVPQGGELAGGTQVVVLGTGFVDHAVHCRFGTELVRARLLNGTALECTVPARPSITVRAVEVTLNNEPAVNGEPAAHSLTSDGVEYHFYDPAAVQVTGVFPLGGPPRGGTLVTLTGSGFYDHGGVGRQSVFCRFGDLGFRAESPADPTIHLRWGRMDGVVPATLLSSTQLLCESPPAGLDDQGYAVDAGAAVDVALMFNGDLTRRLAWIETSIFFSYENATTRVDATLPVAGPSSGGSLLNVSGVGFADLGQLTCRFGSPAMVSNATLVSSSMVQCRSPPYSGPVVFSAASVASKREWVRVSLNGQQYFFSDFRFVYYSQERVRVSALVPQGSELAGGTQVVVLGTGFVDHAVHCRFGTELVRARLLESVVVTLTASGGVEDYTDSVVSNLQQRFATAAFLRPRTDADVGAAQVGVEKSFVTINVMSASAVATADTSVRITATIAVPRTSPELPATPATPATTTRTAAVVQGALSSVLGTVDGAYFALGMREMGLAVKTAPTFKTISGNEARTALECTAPARPSAVVQAVEVTLNNEPAVNGEPAAHSLTSDGVEYHFYDPAAVQVTGVFPLGGPSRGGTLVTLTGSGFYDRGGVFCRFGDLGHRAQSPDDPTIHLRWGRMDGVVPATLLSSTQLLCESPPGGLDTLGRAVDAGSAVDVALTLNADHGAYIETSAVFFYENATTRVDATLPVAGPSSGGSLLNVSGVGFADWGQLTCRFGSPEMVSSATLVSSNLVQCRSPPYVEPVIQTTVPHQHGASGQNPFPESFPIPFGAVAGKREWVRVSPNGQQYFFSDARFVYYSQERVRVSALVPQGGELAGGTQVVVLGTGFVDHAGHCRFGTELVRARLLESVVVTLTASGGVADYTDSVVSNLQQRFATAAGADWPPMTDNQTRQIIRQVDRSFVTINVTSATVIATDTNVRITATIAVPVTAIQTAAVVQGALSSVLGTVDDAYKALGMREMGLAVKTAPTFKTISGNEARTALECTAPARPSAVVQAVEVTLNNEPAVNGEPAAHSLTSDGVEYHFYDPAAVQVTGVFPLGGPSRGGTLVTLTGSGFYDRGGVFCRFGALRAGGYRHLDWQSVGKINFDGAVPATLLSSTQLLCRSPPQPASDYAMNDTVRFRYIDGGNPSPSARPNPSPSLNPKHNPNPSLNPNPNRNPDPNPNPDPSPSPTPDQAPRAAPSVTALGCSAPWRMRPTRRTVRRAASTGPTAAISATRTSLRTADSVPTARARLLAALICTRAGGRSTRARHARYPYPYP